MKFRSTAVRSTLTAMVCGCVLLWMTGCKGHKRKATSPPNTTDYAGNVERLDKFSTLTGLRWPNYADDLGNVQKFYNDRDNELAWTRDGKPTNAAMALLQLFQDAAAKGLNPTDYDVDTAGQGRWTPRLTRLAAIAKAKDTSDAAQDAVAQFDVAMTISAMRYFEDLHVGRVNPQALNFDIDTPQKRAAFDVATLLNNQVVDAENVAQVAESVEPVNPMYKATEQALAAYRELAMQQGAAMSAALPPLPSGAKPVGVGGAYAAVPELWARLQLEGDAAADDAAAKGPQSYNAEVAAAVKHYQGRHGLQDDGKLGQATIDSLNVPMSVRVQQLENSLERWRWLPDNYMQPRVMANLPEFMLRTYEADHTLAFKMKVIDGEAKGNHDTPMFVRLMRYVVFRPYWNLPPSIIKKEIVPHLEKSGLGYLAANDYQVYKNDGTVVTDFTVHDIEHLKYNVRQLPGPKNSLGLVKFLFPNSYDVYMHSTPELYLFGLYKRDRSHGCVRLQHADQMALWVLHGDQSDPDAENGWDADKVDLAMTGDMNNRTYNLKTPLPVVIAYFTAMPDEDGTTHFFNDIYGYDKDLEAALAKGRPYERDEVKINPKLVPGETE
ncbi:murein L,D-transpeptidase [Granulicella sp. L46]|uniref:L,D-transpeptidase family protein n=1 Tax=Granulicella sp. L46 TaxID=1641865 RepID=UPI00131ECEC8|nr:L,D-transpeptidase family protein [Granulicella sp. L46]